MKRINAKLKELIQYKGELKKKDHFYLIFEVVQHVQNRAFLFL